jgi:hypothetical protein
MTREETFHGLNCWYKYSFEKLGWMLLAKNHGHKLQLDAYKNSVNELINHLTQKNKSTVDVDNKNDLKILLKNAKILKKYIDETL